MVLNHCAKLRKTSDITSEESQGSRATLAQLAKATAGAGRVSW